MKSLLSYPGRVLAAYLSRPSRNYQPAATSRPALLRHSLQPGDVLLVEGNTRIATAIKYLTQSTWSHAAFHIGGRLAGGSGDRDPPSLIEADVVAGVRAVPVSRYEDHHTRICRPAGLDAADISRMIEIAVGRIGDTYDLRNVLDLARYLIATPPVPSGWRRRMIALGSGQPTRAICSTLIAQLFQAVAYPILPEVETRPAPREGCDGCVEEILNIRHHTLFAPRDFDVSPYFAVIKPTIEAGFEHRRLLWAPVDDAARTVTVPSGLRRPGV